MDRTVHARFWRVSEPAEGVSDFPDILHELVAKPVAGDRAIEIAEGLIVRLERCDADGEFIQGEFCRVQLTNFPPEVGPDGLSPIPLGEGHGLGHLAAFRYHVPTRVLLLQRNLQSTSTNRLSLYLAATQPGRLFFFAPIMCADAMERFQHKSPRSFSMTFAAPENLAVLDDDELPAAQGARLLAEAYGGVRVTIEISVGKSRKLHLNKEAIFNAVNSMLGRYEVKKLKARADDAAGDDIINFLQEQLQHEDKIELPDGDPDANYRVRNNVLIDGFGHNMDSIMEQFG